MFICKDIGYYVSLMALPIEEIMGVTTVTYDITSPLL